MLIWSRRGRSSIWLGAGLLIGIVYLLPLAVIVLSSFAGEWNGVMPTKLTLAHYQNAVTGDSGRQIWSSLVTGGIASACALIAGTWAAVLLGPTRGLRRRVLEPILFTPSAVPSVSVGLGAVGRIQPAAASAQRYDGNCYHCALRAGVCLYAGQRFSRASPAVS